jgi:hypothetical protein
MRRFGVITAVGHRSAVILIALCGIDEFHIFVHLQSRFLLFPQSLLQYSMCGLVTYNVLQRNTCRASLGQRL